MARGKFETKIVTQVCHECGKTFDLEYSNEFGCGSYSYVTEPCGCESDFSPIEGEPGINEWLLQVSKDEVLEAVDTVCGCCFAMYDSDWCEIDGFCETCPVRYHIVGKFA